MVLIACMGILKISISTLKTKEAFILPCFDYYSQIGHHCGARNINKLERVNESALKCV